MEIDLFYNAVCFNSCHCPVCLTIDDVFFAENIPDRHTDHMEGTLKQLEQAGWRRLPYRNWGKVWFCPYCAEKHIQSDDNFFKDDK